jgi:hypothetical protein
MGSIQGQNLVVNKWFKLWSSTKMNYRLYLKIYEQKIKVWYYESWRLYCLALSAVRDRPFNLQGGLWFFVSFRIFFRTTQELEYYFFFQNSTLGYMSNTLNQIIFFFPPPKSEYFFQQHWESEYFFRKKNHNPPSS